MVKYKTKSARGDKKRVGTDGNILRKLEDPFVTKQMQVTLRKRHLGFLKTGNEMVWVAKRINLWVCDIMITRKRYLGRPMSIMSLPTPQGRQKTQANHTCFLGILSSIDRQDKDFSTKNNITNLRQCTAFLYLFCLGQDEKWGAKND